jgi:hypothetical protein
MLERLSRFALDAVGSLRIRSALYPFMWACPIIGSMFIFAAFIFKFDHTISMVFALASVAPVALFCVVGLFLAFFKSERLQSEEWQLRQQSLQIIQEKGGTIKMDPTSLQSIATPHLLESDHKAKQ